MVCQHPGHVAPPTNAPGPLGCFKRCHCIGVLAALPDCLVCMVPLGLGLQPVSSFTTKRQLVGGLACQTGHNGALCAVAAIGCWHLACVGGAHRHLHCGLQASLKQPGLAIPVGLVFREMCSSGQVRAFGPAPQQHQNFSRCGPSALPHSSTKILQPKGTHETQGCVA